MAITNVKWSWRWIQIACLAALGAIALASATWGQVVEPIAPQDPNETREDFRLEVVQADAKWPPKPLAEININPHDPSDKKPADSSGELIDSSSPDHWFNATYAYQVASWTAPNLRYNPLYFEDVALERYGQVRWGHFDAARSGILFYGGMLALPYNMLVISPHGCETPLGFARPGSPAPATRNYLFYRH